MVLFKIYQFEDNAVEIIPENWLSEHNQVQWNYNALKHINQNKKPNPQWKFYNVKAVTSKTYATYELAEKAIKKILNGSKADIETDDLSDTECNTYTTNENNTTENIQQNQYVVVPIDFLNNLNSMVEKIKSDVDCIKSILNKEYSTNTCLNVVECFKSKEFLPLNNINELKAFDNKLESEEMKIDFVKYLKSKIICEQNLKQLTVMFIETIYSLELQTMVNFVGANGKFCLKKLKSTQIIAKTLSETASDLKTLHDKDSIKSAFIEFRYHMQHTCDRVKAVQHKSTSINRVRHNFDKFPMLDE